MHNIGLRLVPEKDNSETYLAEMWDLKVDASTQSCSQIWWAGQNVTEMLVPHKLPSFLLDQCLHLIGKRDQIISVLIWLMSYVYVI